MLAWTVAGGTPVAEALPVGARDVAMRQLFTAACRQEHAVKAHQRHGRGMVEAQWRKVLFKRLGKSIQMIQNTKINNLQLVNLKS